MDFIAKGLNSSLHFDVMATRHGKIRKIQLAKDCVAGLVESSESDALFSYVLLWISSDEFHIVVITAFFLLVVFYNEDK